MSVEARYPDLLAVPSVERWLRKKEETTKELYLFTFKRILETQGKDWGFSDPESLVKWAENHKPVDVQDLIEKAALAAKGRASQTTAAVVLRSFLKRNGLQLPSAAWDSHASSWHRGLRREEVQRYLSFLDNKHQKAYVMFAKDSGLRVHHILQVRYRHIKKDFEADQEYVYVDLEPEFYYKRKAAGRTFIGPDTTRLLHELVEEGRIKRDPDARLFPWLKANLRNSLRLALRKAGLDHSIQPSHGLRKFFMYALDRVGMDHHKKLLLEGHSLGIRGAYTDRDIEELRVLYKQAYSFLDLTEEAATDLKFGELQDELVKARTELDLYKSKVMRVDDLERRLGMLEIESVQRYDVETHRLGPKIRLPPGTNASDLFLQKTGSAPKPSTVKT